MTVSPRGDQPRVGQATPSTGETADSTVLPPTLLRLPNLDPAHQQTLQLARRTSAAVGASGRGPTPSATRTATGKSQPQDPTASKFARDPAPNSQRTAEFAARAPAPTDPPAAMTPPDRTVSPPEDTRSSIEHPAPERPAERAEMRPSEMPQRGTPQQAASTQRKAVAPTHPADPVPEGRSWMERMGSQSTVLLVLLAITATAIIAGQRRESGSEQPPAHPSQQTITTDPLAGPEVELAEQPSASDLSQTSRNAVQHHAATPPERPLDAAASGRTISQPSLPSVPDVSQRRPASMNLDRRAGGGAVVEQPPSAGLELTRPTAPSQPASATASDSSASSNASISQRLDARADATAASEQISPSRSPAPQGGSAAESAAPRSTRTPNGIVDWSYYVPEPDDAGFEEQTQMNFAGESKRESKPARLESGPETDAFAFPTGDSTDTGRRLSTTPPSSSQR